MNASANLKTVLAAAAKAFEHRDFEAAERACRTILAADSQNADALHLLGLCLKQAGELGTAATLIEASIEHAPARTEFRINLSNLQIAQGRLDQAIATLRAATRHDRRSRPARLALSRALNQAGAHAEAEAAARELLALAPRDAHAWGALAAAQSDLGKPAEAETSYRQALALEPSYGLARHNLGALLGRLKRAAESLAELDRAAALGIRGPEIDLNRSRALIDLGDLDTAESGLAQLVARTPELVDAQVTLAKLRYQRGDPEFARALAAAARRATNPHLPMALGDLLRRAGQLDSAEAVLREQVRRYPDIPEMVSSLAVVLQERGRLDEAGRHARKALHLRPDDPTIAENLIAILLQRGDGEEPWPLILRERAKAPWDQRWLAYEATAARLRQRPEYERLYDYERFVHTFELEPPPGYASLGDFNGALAEALRPQHEFKTHPLDQSLRHGTQSTRDLRGEPAVAMRAFFDALVEPLDEYRRRIGFDARHPFLERNAGPIQLSGCWSVQLHRHGYHVNHVHPEGWISSAYYVSVPAEVADTQHQRGWIKFGEPRMPTPGATPERLVQPRAGRLVLFPSYLWHGTTPIEDEAPRLTLAFDATPAAAPR